jgi:Flp pilus assembly protein TadB
VALGLIALGALFYVDDWYWPVICTVVGVASLAAGVYVWLARRRHRSRR